MVVNLEDLNFRGFWEDKMILWVYIFVAYVLLSLSYIAKIQVIFVDIKHGSPQKFESHEN